MPARKAKSVWSPMPPPRQSLEEIIALVEKAHESIMAIDRDSLASGPVKGAVGTTVERMDHFWSKMYLSSLLAKLKARRT